MKYFFLSDSWTTGRVWEFGGLWNEQAWNRMPHLQKQPLYIQEKDENLWLYEAEESVLMVEVMPKAMTQPTIGQVVLKRLLSAEQVVERLCKEDVFHPRDLRSGHSKANRSAHSEVTSQVHSPSVTQGVTQDEPDAALIRHESAAVSV